MHEFKLPVHRRCLSGSISSLLLATLLISCSSEQSNPVTTTTAVANPDSPLLGIWEASACRSTANESRNDSRVFRADGTFLRTQNAYSSDNCLNLIYTITRSGNFFEGNSRLQADGRLATEIDYIQDGPITATLLTDSVVSEFNAAGNCGVTDWQLGVARDVTGCRVGLREIVEGPDTYDVYHIANDHFLYVGGELAFVPEFRPEVVGSNPRATRQLSAEADFPAGLLGFWDVATTDQFVEFRRNANLYIYNPSESQANCFELEQFAYIPLGGEQYSPPSGILFTFSLTDANNALVIDHDNGNQFRLVKPLALRSTDLTLCQTLPGGERNSRAVASAG